MTDVNIKVEGTEDVKPTNEVSATMKTVVLTILAICAASLVIAAIVVMTRDCTVVAEGTYSAKRAAMYTDDGDAAHLAQTHPELGKVCKIAGTCDAVTATFWSHAENNGGRDIWNIAVPGATDKTDPLYGVVGAGDSLDEAARNFIDTYRANQAMKAYKR